MGKGDKKSKKGKLFMGSYGNVRPRKNNTKTISSNNTKPTKKKSVKKKKTSAKNK